MQARPSLLKRSVAAAFFALSVTSCGSNTHPGSGTSGGGNAGDSGGSAPSAGSATGGDAARAGSNTAGANAAGSAAGGANTAGSAAGGVNTGGSVTTGGKPTGDWADVSPPSSNKNCSGVVVNRLTGDVLTDVTNQGIWQSSNQGGDWKLVDGNVVGGLIVLGPGFDVDQNDPKRVAAWSLDGDAGWTNDGVSWKKMASINRNWDFGSIDWASPDPKTMMVTRHESDAEVYLSTDGAATWNLMSIEVLASGGPFPPPAFAMVGVMDEKTLIYGNGAGILRSTDTGKTFTKVSDLNARTRVPVLFKGVFYLGGDGLLVSNDKGATWKTQGAKLEIWIGPYFGEDENHMMVANKQGVYLTSDAGTTFTKVAPLPTDSHYDPQIWGGFAWDPSRGVLYAAAVGVPLLKLDLD